MWQSVVDIWAQLVIGQKQNTTSWMAVQIQNNTKWHHEQKTGLYWFNGNVSSSLSMLICLLRKSFVLPMMHCTSYFWFITWSGTAYLVIICNTLTINVFKLTNNLTKWKHTHRVDNICRSKDRTLWDALVLFDVSPLKEASSVLI